MTIGFSVVVVDLPLASVGGEKYIYYRRGPEVTLRIFRFCLIYYLKHLKIN